MKDNKGFTLVELLAVIIIIGILAIIVIPAFTEVYSSIKASNRNAKIQELEKAAEKYGTKIKDKVKDAFDKGKNYLVGYTSNNDNNKYSKTNLNTSAAFLIKKGYIASDVESDPQIIDPVDNSAMNGDIYLTYCDSTYDIEAHYVDLYLPNKIYYAGDYVSNNNEFYMVAIIFKPNQVYSESDGKCGKKENGNYPNAKEFAIKNKSRYERCIQQPTEDSINGELSEIVNPFGQHFFVKYTCQGKKSS